MFIYIHIYIIYFFLLFFDFLFLKFVCVVCRVRHRKNGVVCARKSIDCTNDAKHKMFKLETVIMSRLRPLNCPHIVEFEDAAYDINKVGTIYMRWIPGGNLFHWLRQERGEGSALSVLEAGLVAKQVLLALKAMNSINVMHRDIKPENLLVDSSQVYDYQLHPTFPLIVLGGKNRKFKI